jgi:hypothetical protein
MIFFDSKFSKSSKTRDSNPVLAPQHHKLSFHLKDGPVVLQFVEGACSTRVLNALNKEGILPSSDYFELVDT